MVDLGSLTLSDVRRGTQVQGRIIGALFLRELRTRFGSMQLGYAWALIEPLVQITILVEIFSILGRRPPLGTFYASFFLTGYLPYFVFSQLANRAATAISANRALLTFPPVRNMDTAWARIFLEVATGFASFLLLAAVFAFLDIPVIPNDVVQFALAFLAISCLGAGMGMVNAAMSTLFDWWMIIFGWFLRLQYFFCGIFFLSDALPPGARVFALVNPLAHCITWAREGFYRGYTSPYLDKVFPFTVAIVLMIVGLSIERIFRRKVSEL
jgi:capsular polysaccharide transport system permease protein